MYYILGSFETTQIKLMYPQKAAFVGAYEHECFGLHVDQHGKSEGTGINI